MQGKIQEMITILKQALAIQPVFPKALSDLGYALHKQGDLQGAILSYRKALSINPELPDALSRLGTVFDEQGDLQGAVLSYRKALAINPDFVEALNNLGNILQRQEEFKAAITCYKKALAINPNLAEVFNNLGSALREQGDLDAAVVAGRKALAINPNYPDAFTNLGNTLREQGEMDAAIVFHKKAMTMNPHDFKAFANLGCVFWEQGDLSTAIDFHRKAISLSSYSTVPGHYGSLRYNLSCLLLLSGDYKSGWEEYGWRFYRRRKVAVLHAHPRTEQWTGSNTSTEELVLVSEQALGDALQFMRYVLYLKEKGMNVSFCAQTKLHGLIRASGLATVLYTPAEADTLTTGSWLPLMSLPKYLNVTPDNPLVTTPYLKAPEEKVLRWKQKLAGEKRPVIGINWQGNLRAETSTCSRSFPLEAFSPIAKQTGVSFLSLQKGPGSEELPNCSFRHRFVSCQDEIDQIWDFAETAAMIINCDLVITNDTAIAHLAGGLGHPTWLLLKKMAEWRWGPAGETTFWYPSMRIFRQKERNNWQEVTERVAIALQEMFPGSQHQKATAISVPIAFAELLDKITILEIKSEKFHGQKKVNVDRELNLLQQVLHQSGVELVLEHHQQLKAVNESLWRIEEDIRDHELRQDFGEGFIKLARSVYLQNDKRAAIKRLINDHYGSELKEEKSYSKERDLHT